MATIQELEEQLNDFNFVKRRTALEILSDRLDDLEIAEPTENMNGHAHSFYSFNRDGHSPLRIVWDDFKAGRYATGLIEFNVLDQVTEAMQASRLLGHKVFTGVEARLYSSGHEGVVVNSPKEPAIVYAMGLGFARNPKPDSKMGKLVERMRTLEQVRCKLTMNAINNHLEDKGKTAGVIAYDSDVLPLTPAGNTMERHLLQAYFDKVMNHFGNNHESVASYWSNFLPEDRDTIVGYLESNPVQLQESIRGNLMKYGTPGYIEPNPENFVTLDEFWGGVASEGGLPTIAWLNGATPGEADPVALLRYGADRGVRVLNIIPDRNFSADKPLAQDDDYLRMVAISAAAREMAMYINLGTELNSHKVPRCDDLYCEQLKGLRPDAINCADFLYAHTMQQLDG